MQRHLPFREGLRSSPTQVWSTLSEAHQAVLLEKLAALMAKVAEQERAKADDVEVDDE